MKESKISIKNSKQKIQDLLNLGKKYSLLIFILIVGIVYGSLLLKTNSLINSGSETTDEVVQSNANNLPKIDDEVVQKLESLKDNSVSVQSIFEEARNNPFQ